MTMGISVNKRLLLELTGTMTLDSDMPRARSDATACSASSEGADQVHSPERQSPPYAGYSSHATALVEAGELLRALAAPVRIALVLALREGEACVHELVEALDVTQPLISQHLRVLKAAGVVRGERRGREVVYSLVDEHLSHIVLDAVAHAGESEHPR